MLKVENISQIEIHSPEWKQARLAKLTSSMMYTLMGDKMLTEKGSAYIYEKVGEEMTGIPANYEVDTTETRHGLIHEPTAILKLGQYLNATFLVTQKFISAPGKRFSSTPDALWVKNKFADGYEVETGEVKCYPSYSHYIQCVLCDTPEQLKAVDKKLYWQVMDQMDNCDALVGYAALYHPDFRVGGFKVIKFRMMEMKDEFKFLRERKSLALKKFDEIRDRLLTLKN